MNLLLWVFVGGIVGWVASIAVGAGASTGTIANVAVGIAGAIVGGWLSGLTNLETEPSSAFHTTDARAAQLFSFVWSLISAVMLLLALNLLVA